MLSEIYNRSARARGEGQLTYIIKELGASVPLDVVSVEISPTELNVDPELVASGAIKDIFRLNKKVRYSLRAN